MLGNIDDFSLKLDGYGGINDNAPLNNDNFPL